MNAGMGSRRRMLVAIAAALAIGSTLETGFVVAHRTALSGLVK